MENLKMELTDTALRFYFGVVRFDTQYQSNSFGYWSRKDLEEAEAALFPKPEDLMMKGD